MSVIKNKPYMDQLNSAGYVSRQDEESVQKPPLVQKRLRPKPPVHFSFLLHRAPGEHSEEELGASSDLSRNHKKLWVNNSYFETSPGYLSAQHSQYVTSTLPRLHLRSPLLCQVTSCTFPLFFFSLKNSIDVYFYLIVPWGRNTG